MRRNFRWKFLLSMCPHSLGSYRAHRSVGRSPPLQGGGRGFKSRWVHLVLLDVPARDLKIRRNKFLLLTKFWRILFVPLGPLTNLWFLVVKRHALAFFDINLFLIDGKLESVSFLMGPFFYEKWLVRISDSDRSIKLVLVVKKNAIEFFDVHLFLING